jgi:cell fate (sporulation/competence/biofilm development) regulator YlbF (YheA/YmcA/DUF963 family)
MVEAANPYDKAHELAQAIKASNVYLDYLAAKRELEKDQELKEKLLEFRTRQMEINRTQMLGGEVPDGNINEITLEFAKMNQKKEFADFFNAEGQFIQMFNDIQEIMQKAIESGFEE